MSRNEQKPQAQASKRCDIIGSRFVSLLDEYVNPADALAQLFSALSR